MLPSQLRLLQYFGKNEKDINGQPVDWNNFEFQTMQELDRLRNQIGSKCILIRGNHGFGKETAVDAYFPEAPFATVVMALFRSGYSKGLYQGGSIHLDSRMSPNGLARCWLAFKPAAYEYLVGRGFGSLRSYTADGWDYYQWGSPESFGLLKELVAMNSQVAA